MNIFNFFKKKGINTLDPEFYRKIEKWKSWYVGNVRNFSTYRIYSGQGTYAKRKRRSLGMAKRVSEDLADLLLNERVKITVSDATTDAFVNEVLTDNNFLVLGNDFQERKAYTGTVAYIPYLCDAEMAGDGSITGGRIGINYVCADNIFPVSWDNGRVKECVFAFPKVINRKKYVQLQYHHLNKNGMYEITNTVLENIQGSQDGKELTPEEWKQLRPFQNLAANLETNSTKPQFVIDRLNIVNNADIDTTNPMGIAVFANAIDILKELDNVFDSYDNEFTLGKKRIFVAPEMLKTANGSPAFDPEDSVFYKLPEDYAERESGKSIVEVNMEIRAEQHSKAINDGLNYLSMKCGFGTERYRFENGNVRTATEVISANSDMFRTLKKHEIILDDVIKELVWIIIRLGIVTGKSLNLNSEITIDFDDSIIEDKTAERQNDRNDVAMGAMPLWEYRMKWYNEDEKTAKAAVAVQDKEDVIE